MNGNKLNEHCDGYAINQKESLESVLISFTNGALYFLRIMFVKIKKDSLNVPRDNFKQH